MSLRALLERLEGPDEAYDMQALIAGSDTNLDTLTLRLELAGLYEESLHESWRVHCSAIADWRLVDGHADPLRLWNEHPLLWEHTQRRAELFFLGRPADPMAAAGALYERHLRETWDCVSPTQFLNRGLSLDLSRLLDGGHGQLALGPAPLLNAYADVMSQWDVRTSMLDHRGPAHTEAQARWLSDGRDFALLTLGESSYVIAMDFAAERTA
jgi:hypothetical protein